MVLGNGEGAGGHHLGIQRLWALPGDGELLPISGVGDLSGGQRLAGSDQEFGKGEGGVEEDGEDPQKGGGGATSVGIFL